jgi:hypothetical protein
MSISWQALESGSRSGKIIKIPPDPDPDLAKKDCSERFLENTNRYGTRYCIRI